MKKPEIKKGNYSLDSLNTAFVYSTNKDLMEKGEDSLIETPAPSSQTLYVSLDKKNRGGKTVTLIENFQGNENDFIDLSKKLKTKCGVGGSAKDGEIIIQGDFREKIIQILQQEGYKIKRKGG